jgi:DNA adenine methylase
LNAQLRLVDVADRRLMASPTLTPFLKWPGGKSQELRAIAAASPELTGRFIDPFVGGGSVLLAVPADVPAWANDAAEDLIRLYQAASSESATIRAALLELGDAWDNLADLHALYAALGAGFVDPSGSDVAAIVTPHLEAIRLAVAGAGPYLPELLSERLTKDLRTKFGRMRRVELAVGSTLSASDLLANVEGSVRSAFYMSIRTRYNRARLAGSWDAWRLADFFFLREFTYAAMFRFNSRGEFNVPYGGISYNRKSLNDKTSVLFGSAMLARLSNTQWRCSDFEGFLGEAEPATGDFVFIDPPYDSDFSDYDNLPFGWQDQERLQQALESLDANVMVVIKDTPMIRRLYRSDRWRTTEAAKTYMWTIKSRNDRETTHLTITNY